MMCTLIHLHDTACVWMNKILHTVPVTSYLRDSDEFCINPLKVSLDGREGCCKSSVRFPRTTGAGSAEGLKFPWTTDKDGIEDMHRLRPLSRDGELTADA